MLQRLALLVATLALGLIAMPAAAERLIVKFRDSNAAKALVAPAKRVAELGADAGIALAYERDSVLGARLVLVDDATLAVARLAGHADVEYAVPDRRWRALRESNDEFLAALTYLENTPVGISAFAAWDITTGSASTVVAVLDTGYRPHADLAGRILPGYDFVSDFAHANDGGGRDADASDPGDWINAADIASGAFSDDCRARNSTWHGTSVAGVIAANSNNGQWDAGIDWAARILPVRVLGKCEGSTSDIMEGVAWSAGLNVPGVPPNPTPAQVINLSLGGEGTCSAYENQIFAAALAHGVTKAIVVAAGNADADATGYTPAGCAGVITVASTTSLGNKARYSNFGPIVALSAPGGSNPVSGQDGIFALSNKGLTVPGADGIANIDGTSFSAPMVAGTVSLMLAVAPNLSAAQVRDILVTTAKPFLVTSTCTTAICGAGIVDAHAAVVAAQAAGGGATTRTVVEYYNATLDHYFVTWVPAEQANLDAGNTPTRWNRTGASFKMYTAAEAGTSPVCRYYIPPAKGDSHFFGRGTAECNATGANNPTFVLEDPAFMQMVLPTAGTCPAGTQIVYRVFSNRADANHRYMTDRALRDQMVTKGWLAEGDGPDLVVMCAPN